MKPSSYIFILIPILLQILSVSLFKEAALSMDSFTLLNVLTNVLYLFCFMIFFLRALSWQYALRIFPLSVAYNFQSLAYLGILLVGHFVFNESITLYNVIGSFIIVIGVLRLYKGFQQ